MRFEGKAVVISGAGGGIGTALTRRFLQESAEVFGLDRDEAALRRLVATTSGHPALSALAMDVSSEADCASVAASVEQLWSGLDILVNNAGYFPVRYFEDMTYQEWRQVCAINLDSVFLMSKALVPLMKRRGGGRIVNIGSGSVFKGPARQSHYVAAKAGVIGFTRCLANEVGRHGITVNVVTPGLTATAGAMNIFTAQELEARAQMRPIKRVQTAEDVVGAVVFLASDAAAFITGQTVNVDGGVTMH
jgi:NAD(P)-dependent dehydrogenase (short-subunit alcohol dehydrogenase family)